MTRKISIPEVNDLDRDGFVARFGAVYERSPWVAEATHRARPFTGLDGLHGAMARAVGAAPEARKLALIRSHPDLAGKAATAGELTPESAGEQAAAGLDRLSPEEYEAFTGLNDAYKKKFGIPMIFAVREHTKRTILENAGARLGNSREEEVERALEEINKIARYRLQETVEEGEKMTVETAAKLVLGHTNYGKSDVRLVKVYRDGERHSLTETRVDVSLTGDFGVAHVEGDNTGLLATDTMRNTIYGLAKDHLDREIEPFGLALVDHFLEAGPKVTGVRIHFTEHLWDRIVVDGREHEHSFVRAAGVRTATVEGDGGGSRRVEAGIDDLIVLKTTESGWEGFLRERFTTLPETRDRILSTAVKSKWVYNTTGVDFNETWRGVKGQILATFTDHYSPSVQNTLYLMGKAVLERFPEIEKIHFSLPNRHHIPYDLERFGLENDGEIFHADAEPYGLIEGWVERTAG